MLDKELKPKELRKPVAEFMKCDHLSMFGRPLLRLHAQGLYRKTVLPFARTKLLGGVRFDNTNMNHVFAATSYWIYLDPVCTPILPH